jgi:anti-sigma B factor antagonist
MEIKEQKQGDVMIVTIDDHLDTAAAPSFEQRLLGLIDGGEHKIVVDCSQLEYVNSAGLKVFLIAAKKLEPLAGQLIVCSLSPSVLMIFEMIGFTRIMKIAPSREDAVRAFGALAG